MKRTVYTSGSGTLLIGRAREVKAAAAMSGTGAMTIKRIPQWYWVMVLNGRGGLAATGVVRYKFAGSASFIGQGGLTAARTYTIPRDIEVTVELLPLAERSATLPERNRWSVDLP